MNKQEQRQKLWCDVMLQEHSYNTFSVKDCASIANEAVKAFDESFGEQTKPTQHVTESHASTTTDWIVLTREEADLIYGGVAMFLNGESRLRAQELLKIK